MQKSINTKPESYSILFLSIVIVHLLVEIFVSTIATKITIPLAMQLIISEMIIVVPGMIYIVIHNSSFTADLGFKKIRISTALMSILLIELLGPLTSLINLLSQFFDTNAVVEISGEVLEGNFWLMLFIVGIFGPFCEEFVFRGIIAKGMGRFGSVIGSALASGLLFGLLHLNFNQFCYAFFLGIIFAVINYATGSIWTSVIMHIVVNSQNVFMMYGLSFLYGDSVNDMADMASEIVSDEIRLYAVGVFLILAIIFTALSIPVFAFIAKNEGNEEIYLRLWDKASQTKKWWLNVYFIIGAIICIVIIFFSDMITKLLS